MANNSTTTILVLAGVAIGGYVLYSDWGNLFPATATAPSTPPTAPPSSVLEASAIATPTAPVTPPRPTPLQAADTAVTTLFGNPTTADASNISAFEYLITSGAVTATQLDQYYAQVQAMYAAANLPVDGAIGYYVYQLASGQMTLAQVTAEFNSNTGVSGLGRSVNRIPAWAIGGGIDGRGLHDQYSLTRRSRLRSVLPV